MARKSQMSTYMMRQSMSTPERVSEVDLMSAVYPLSILRRIERQWAKRVKSLGKIRGQIVAATERTLQHVISNEGTPIPVPVRTGIDRRQLDRSRPRD